MKDVLVRIRGREAFGREADAAARLVADLDGRLTGIYALPVDIPPPSLSHAGLVAAEWALHADRELREAGARQPAFVAWAQQAGARAPDWLVGAGYLPDVLAQAGDWHDVLVLGLDPAGADPWSSSDGVARIVLGVDLPCLVLPPQCQLAVASCTAAIAWNGSPQAIRALHASLPLLQRAGRVVVLEGAAREGSAFLPGFEVERWLRARLSHVEFCRLDPDEQDGPSILEAAHACDAGLLVTGAFGRTRAAEWLLGGVTRHLLHHADLPVLMRH